jgi:7-cyano-7-deazaguanine synthase
VVSLSHGPDIVRAQLALAVAAAVSQKFNRVAIAVHSGDHAIYPDCRPAFLKAMRAVSQIANYEKIGWKIPDYHIKNILSSEIIIPYSYCETRCTGKSTS